jgi:hypothetical protein
MIIIFNLKIRRTNKIDLIERYSESEREREVCIESV